MRLLSPNPAHGRLSMPVSFGAGASTLTLVDTLGRPVRTQVVASVAGQVAVDLTGVAPGVYALRLAAGGTVTTRRFDY